MMPETNPKGRLLELHPEAKFTHEESSDSPPVWTATVTLHGVSTSADGVTKKAADRLAATKVLAGMDILCQAAPAHSLALDERKQVAQAAADRLARRTTQSGGELAWVPVHFDEKHLKPTLKGDDSALDWFLRKDDTHRITCAPVIFSRWVEEVRIWKAKLDTGHLTLIHVQAVGGGLPRVFVSPHPEPASQTRADKTACVQARAYIVEMVGAPPPLVSDTVG